MTPCCHTLLFLFQKFGGSPTLSEGLSIQIWCVLLVYSFSIVKEQGHDTLPESNVSLNFLLHEISTNWTNKVEGVGL